MRNFLTLLVAAFLLGLCLARVAAAQQYDLTLEKQQLKARQKEERKALKLKEKYQKESWKNQLISKSVRDQMKHQMERERRELREKHKDELQDLKDRQRALKESQKQFSQ